MPKRPNRVVCSKEDIRDDWSLGLDFWRLEDLSIVCVRFTYAYICSRYWELCIKHILWYWELCRNHIWCFSTVISKCFMDSTYSTAIS
jgi:hypothetical protein